MHEVTIMSFLHQAVQANITDKTPDFPKLAVMLPLITEQATIPQGNPLTS